MTINRREFGKAIMATSVWAGAGLFFPGGLPGAAADESVVVIARGNELIRAQHDLKKENTLKVLNRAMKRITGCQTAESAWKKLFSPGEKVGIKLSCLPGKYLSSSKGLVMAIVDGLMSANVKGSNIFIWERSNRELQSAGFQVTRNGINVFGTDNIIGGGYSSRVEISRSVGTCFSLILESVDALISVPVLKDHDVAGVSIGLKNFYGAIHNPNKFHQNSCDPYVADLCHHPFIKNKLRLTVCDASRVQVHNGPAFYPRYAREYGGLLVSTDPVALDYTGWQIIEEMRKKLKLKSLKESGREPTYLFSAEKLKLGNASEKKIRLIEI